MAGKGTGACICVVVVAMAQQSNQSNYANSLYARARCSWVSRYYKGGQFCIMTTVNNNTFFPQMTICHRAQFIQHAWTHVLSICIKITTPENSGLPYLQIIYEDFKSWKLKLEKRNWVKFTQQWNKTANILSGTNIVIFLYVGTCLCQ